MISLSQTRARSTAYRGRFSFWAYLALYRQRKALAALEADQLRDLGLTREMAQKEANRPFWDAPDHWKQR